MILESISIENFALLKKATIDFGKGFNVITGETGAGKSILVGALSMVLGEWVGREIVRTGEDTCEVEAVFSGDISGNVVAFLKERDLENDDLILRRKFYEKGRSRCLINDHPVTLRTLRDMGNLIVDIHSQHQHQALLNRNEQLILLDRFAGNGALLKETSAIWKKYSDLKKEREKMISSRDSVIKDIERLNHEISEIEAAGLYEGIEDDIEKEFRVLNNAEKLRLDLEAVYARLYEEEGAVIDSVNEMTESLRELGELDDKLNTPLAGLSNAAGELETVSEEIRSYLGEIDSDPQRLEEVLDLRDKLFELKRKYGQTVEDILAYYGDIKNQVEGFETADDDIAKLDKSIKETEKELETASGKLSARRKKASEKLRTAVVGKLGKLGIAGADFEARIISGDPGPRGKETAEFFIRTNPGEPLMELSKIASGGEVSRVMLAVKAALAEADSMPLLVFDEIDQGIGATIAGPVGDEMKKLAEYHQIITITHLPQIAGFADMHIRVFKTVEGGRSFTRIGLLEGEDRVKEIARMFGGAEELSSRQAREILKKN